MKLFAFLLITMLTLAAVPARAQGFNDTVAATGEHAPDGGSTEAVAPLVDEQVASLLRDQAQAWDGTRYRYGGTSRTGIDCSALMQRWFSDLFGQALPRTAESQFANGTAIDRADLRPGDLVFFGGRASITHVGVYVGKGEFAHASRSVGVTVSRMSKRYWTSRYRGARRVLGLNDTIREVRSAVETVVTAHEVTVRSAAPSFTKASARAPRTATRPRRTGW